MKKLILVIFVALLASLAIGCASVQRAVEPTSVVERVAVTVEPPVSKDAVVEVEKLEHGDLFYAAVLIGDCEMRESNGRDYLSLGYYLELIDENGAVVFSEYSEDRDALVREDFEDRHLVYMRRMIVPPNAEPGVYRVRFRVRDFYAEIEGVGETTFEVERRKTAC